MPKKLCNSQVFLTKTGSVCKINKISEENVFFLGNNVDS
jgi:hypothetical protein